MTREKLNERAANIEALRKEAIGKVLGMTDEECAVVLEALKIHKSDETKRLMSVWSLQKKNLAIRCGRCWDDCDPTGILDAA